MNVEGALMSEAGERLCRVGRHDWLTMWGGRYGRSAIGTVYNHRNLKCVRCGCRRRVVHEIGWNETRKRIRQ